MDENEQGVVLIPAGKEERTVAVLIDFSTGRLWFKVGDTYDWRDSLHYPGEGEKVAKNSI